MGIFSSIFVSSFSSLFSFFTSLRCKYGSKKIFLLSYGIFVFKIDPEIKEQIVYLKVKKKTNNSTFFYFRANIYIYIYIYIHTYIHTHTYTYTRVQMSKNLHSLILKKKKQIKVNITIEISGVLKDPIRTTKFHQPHYHHIVGGPLTTCHVQGRRDYLGGVCT